MSFLLFLIGFLSIFAQVVILRELAVAYFGVELIYILALGFWLIMTGLGAVLYRKLHDVTTELIVIVLATVGILIPLDVLYIRGIHQIFSGVRGAYLSFPLQMLSLLIALLPVGICLGLLFRWAAEKYIAPNRNLAQAYAIESAGGIIGGVCSTLGIAIGISNLSMGLICAFIGLTGYFAQKKTNSLLLRTFILLIAVVTVAGSLLVEKIDFLSTRWNHPDLVFSSDTPYGRLSVEQRFEQVIFFSNNSLYYESQSVAAEEFVHLAALQREQAGRALIVGGGVEGTIFELLKHKPAAIDYFELNEDLIELSEKYLPDSIYRTLQHPRVKTFIDEPRQLVDEVDETYDMILIGMPEPNSGQSNRFYTKEFFKLCSKRLNPDGILTFRLRAAENLWTPQLRRRTASVYNALKAVFSDVVILPGSTITVIGSNRSLESDPAVVAQRFAGKNIEARLVSPEYIEYLYTNDRFQRIKEMIEAVPAIMNRDVHPVCFQYALMQWIGKFYPMFTRLDISALQSFWLLPAVVLAVLLALALTLIRVYESLRGVILVFAAGFLGMLDETLLILYYQLKSGALFQDLGVLLTAFMAGLTIGAYIIGSIFKPDLTPANRRNLGLILFILFGLFNFALSFLIRSGEGSSLVIVSILIFISGLFVSMVFGYVSKYMAKRIKREIGGLYAADLAGGALAAVLGSLLLIPSLGLPIVATGVGILSIAAVMLLV